MVKLDLIHSEIVFREDDIVQVNGTDHDYKLKDVLEIHETIYSKLNAKPCYLLLNASKFSSIDSETREYMSSKASKHNFVAKAFIAKSLAHKIILNWLVSVKGTQIPTKFFSNEKSAVTWLKEQQLKNS